MDKPKRFDVFLEKHIGFGIRWDNYYYDLELSIAFPFFTLVLGIGRVRG